MTAPTTQVRYLLARAAVRATGVLHIVSQRDTGTLQPVCGANAVRSTTIETHTGIPTDGLNRLCPACGDHAAAIAAGSISDGVALYLGTHSPNGVRLTTVALDAIAPVAGRLRPGTDTALADLAESIAEYGVLQPVLLRHVDGELEVVAGARRIAAALLAGHDTIPAIVRDYSDRDAILASLTENLHRQDLDPISLAHTYTHALPYFGGNIAALARAVHLDRSTVSNTLRILQLPADVQAAIQAGTMTATDGLAALAGRGKVSDRKLQRRPADVNPLAAFDGTYRATTRGDRARVTIDLPATDLDRLLEQLGAQVTA